MNHISIKEKMASNFRFRGIQHRSPNGVEYNDACCNQELIVSSVIVWFTEETVCDQCQVCLNSGDGSVHLNITHY